MCQNLSMGVFVCVCMCACVRVKACACKKICVRVKTLLFAIASVCNSVRVIAYISKTLSFSYTMSFQQLSKEV